MLTTVIWARAEENELVRETFIGPQNDINDHTGKLLKSVKEYGNFMPRLWKWTMATCVILAVSGGFIVVNTIAMYMKSRSSTVCSLKLGEWDEVYGAAFRNGTYNPASLSTGALPLYSGRITARI